MTIALVWKFNALGLIVSSSDMRSATQILVARKGCLQLIPPCDVLRSDGKCIIQEDQSSGEAVRITITNLLWRNCDVHERRLRLHCYDEGQDVNKTRTTSSDCSSNCSGSGSGIQQPCGIRYFCGATTLGRQEQLS